MGKSYEQQRGEELQHHHNKGQEDAAAGKYNPPAALIAELWDGEAIENRDAYHQGQSNVPRK